MLWNGATTPALQALQTLQARQNPDFVQALTAETNQRLRDFLAGVRRYQAHPARRDSTVMPVIWQNGTTQLRDYNPMQPKAPVILVIPSLINRFDILDLEPSHSFLHNLARQGWRPIVVDWNATGANEKDFGVNDYITEKLIPILDHLAPQGQAIAVAGYCMGGNLALALAALRPAQIDKLIVMATPWDFHQPHDARARQLASFADNVLGLIDPMRGLSVDLLQSLFGVIQPMNTPVKFARFAVMNPESAEARRFVLVEDWLNDGVPLTANLAYQCLHNWYGQNQLMRGAWQVAGTTVDPRQINIPTYMIVPSRDHLVPPESSLPLAQLLPNVTLHQPASGHIGLMAARSAPQQIWAPLFDWLKK